MCSPRKGFIEIIIPIIFALAVAGGAMAYKYFKKAPDDNIVEELAEDIINQQIGQDFDLSPNSPEYLE